MKQIKNILVASLFLFIFASFTSCTKVKYNQPPPIIKNVNYPPIGKIVTADVGDHLVDKGIIYNENVLIVKKFVKGLMLQIPAGKYPQIGFDDKFDYFSSVGVLGSASESLAITKNQPNIIYVISGAKFKYKADYETKTVRSEKGKSFQQTLIYGGKIGNKINIGYREFKNNIARSAFSNNVEYDLKPSKIIGYKGAKIEVIKADNVSITYKLIKNFK